MSKISLQDLKAEKEDLERKLTVVELMIQAYSEEEKSIIKPLHQERTYQKIESSISKIKVDDNFPKDGKWIERIVYLLEQKNRFLSNTELAESLMQYYPDTSVYHLKRKVSVVISAAYKGKGFGGLTKVSKNNTSKDTVWGFKRWLDFKGRILKEHEPFGQSKSKQYPMM